MISAIVVRSAWMAAVSVSLSFASAQAESCRCASKPAKPASAAAAARASAVASDPGEEAAKPKRPHVPSCALDATFAGVFAVPEASGMAEAELSPGVREMVVISDSGQDGVALAYALPSGPARTFTFPLDPAAGDDTEGIAWRNGEIYLLTSSGAVEEMRPDGHGGVKRIGAAYPLGKPPLVCADLDDGNCGKNFEGLCLRSASSTARCAGYAASKAEGALYCLVIEHDAKDSASGASGGGAARAPRDRLAIDHILPPIKLVLPKNSLSDCAFGSEEGPAAGVLLVSTNVHDGSTVYVTDEKTGALAPIDIGGLPNDEAIAVDHTGALYQAMDDNETPSPALRASCKW